MKISRLDASPVTGLNAKDYDKRARSVAFLRTCLNKPDTRRIFTSAVQGVTREMLLKKCDENGQLNPEGTLIFKVFPDSITIKDAIDPSFEVDVGVDFKEEGVIVSLCIYRTKPEQINNNIWPKAFATEIIRFIESIYYVKTISALWFESSTNTHIFFDELINETPKSVSQTYHIPTQNRKFLQAAKQTWTGQLAGSLGFLKATNFKITYHNQNNYWIEVDFEK